MNQSKIPALLAAVLATAVLALPLAQAQTSSSSASSSPGGSSAAASPGGSAGAAPSGGRSSDMTGTHGGTRARLRIGKFPCPDMAAYPSACGIAVATVEGRPRELASIGLPARIRLV